MCSQRTGRSDRQFQQAVAARGDWSFECRIRRRDGQIRWIWAAGRHRAGPRGESTRMGGIIQDITDRKRAEEEKLEMERRLLHAQKLESIGILAGGIAHDFNNILAGIMGYADLVKVHLPESEPARRTLT